MVYDFVENLLKGNIVVEEKVVILKVCKVNLLVN